MPRQSKGGEKLRQKREKEKEKDHQFLDPMWVLPPWIAKSGVNREREKERKRPIHLLF